MMTKYWGPRPSRLRLRLLLVVVYLGCVQVCSTHVIKEEDDHHHSSDHGTILSPHDKPSGIVVCPRIPEFPVCPRCPDIPTFPSCPEFPEIPKCPEMPNYPQCPETVTVPRSCKDVTSTDPRPVVTLSGGVKVMCDTQTDGGGWMVFQRRIHGDVDFYRGWAEYRDGFGDMDGGDFWLGNEKLHQMTFWTRHEMRVDFTYKGVNYSAVYSSFRVYGEGDNYKLEVGGYSGTAGDSLIASHNGKQFSTKDRDNDEDPNKNCSQRFHGAFWYKSCHQSNLNGKWGSNAYGEGLSWYPVTGHHDTAAFTEMKVRPL